MRVGWRIVCDLCHKTFFKKDLICLIDFFRDVWVKSNFPDHVIFLKGIAILEPHSECIDSLRGKLSYLIVLCVVNVSEFKLVIRCPIIFPNSGLKIKIRGLKIDWYKAVIYLKDRNCWIIFVPRSKARSYQQVVEIIVSIRIR